jgi:hypothetical protein
MTTQPVYIVDIIAGIVQKVQAKVLSVIQANEAQVLGTTNINAINYQYGHFRELIETLAQYDTSPSLRVQKYPLVWLVTDFDELRGKKAGVYADVNLNIIICHQTHADYKSMERKEKVFQPVLYPIYYELMEQLAKDSMTFAASADLIEHRKTDRYYWGTKAFNSIGRGNDANVLNDFVDAIDIQNISLKIDYQPCFP